MKTEYKKGDRVVVELDEIAKFYLNDGESAPIDSSDILGKLEDFQPAQEKIKMTVEEKKEFDWLHGNCLYLSNALSVIFNSQRNDLRNLHKRVSNSISELEFARAWANPELIEVVEPKKYTVKIGDQLLFHRQNNSFGFVYHYGDSKLTLEDVKEAEKQLGIQGLQAKWHEAAKEDGE